MKHHRPIVFDKTQCRKELADFKALLDSKQDLSEQKDLQPLFKRCLHLTAFIGSYVPDISFAKQYAFEFPLVGDFTMDLVVGDSAKEKFLIVEFEDGTPDSISRTIGNKATPEWTPRFDHGFSQIVDWFSMIDDQKNTNDFRDDFGIGHISFTAMLIIGRKAGLAPATTRRLKWRTERVRVDSHSVECVTYDQLYEDLARRIDF
jgi:hypothetical protein